jgi:hypothetical protein
MKLREGIAHYASELRDVLRDYLSIMTTRAAPARLLVGVVYAGCFVVLVTSCLDMLGM